MNVFRALQAMTGDRLRALEKITQHFLWKSPDPWGHIQTAPSLPPEALKNAKVYVDRPAMLSALPKGGRVGEVGVWKGEFSNLIAERCSPAEFHLIDIDFSVYAGPTGVRHEGDSSTILLGLPEAWFDWLYIDGDHTYEGVTKDLKAAHRAIRPGGCLMCNDYTNWCSPSVEPYGVMKAVNELIIAERYRVEGLALHGAGLYDILIRRPG